MKIPIVLYSLLIALLFSTFLAWLDLSDPYWSYWRAAHANSLDEFCAGQHILRDRALAGDDQALGYLLELSRHADAAAGELHGGDLADIFIARGDGAMARAIRLQGQEARKGILAVIPGDFSAGSATFDWKNFPKSRALLPEEDWPNAPAASTTPPAGGGFRTAPSPQAGNNSRQTSTV